MVLALASNTEVLLTQDLPEKHLECALSSFAGFVPETVKGKVRGFRPKNTAIRVSKRSAPLRIGQRRFQKSFCDRAALVGRVPQKRLGRGPRGSLKRVR